MLDDFQRHLEASCPDWKRRRFLVGFSGGLDSTALLHLLARSLPPGQVAAAHLNHLIRPEAGREQALAAATVAGLGLRFLTDSVDVPALAAERRRGLEEAARRARYDFFRRAAAEWPADFVVTAHQADDQAETMLLHLIKGGGAGGLAGIHPRRPLTPGEENGPELLRPLLPFSRDRLRCWLAERELPWAEDGSNLDPRYPRNALRQTVLPELKRINPKFLEAAGRCASILRDEENFWREHLAALEAEIVSAPAPRPGPISLDRRKLEALHPAERRRLIYEAFLKIWRSRPGAPEPLTFAGVESALNMLALPRHAGLDLPGGLRAELTPASLNLSLASRLRNAGA